jgi:RND family efflux transporter MFP subunit
MKKLVIAAVVVVAGLAGVAYYTGMFSGEQAQAADERGAANAQAEGRQGGGQGGGFPGGGGFPAGGGRGNRGNQARPPMTVELATVTRGQISEEITVVGNLIGDATVAVAPRAAGRLQEVYVRLGDRVTRGQRIAKIEDFELQEQIKQQEAGQEVSQATIRQREADLALAKTNVERSRSLFERQLLPKQTLDDNESRYLSSQAQVDLARAQAVQTKARLDELKINLANTIITSPVNGFVSRRLVDPGASVGQNAPVVDVVDITRVRLVANVVEKDLTELQTGDATRVQVDAYPGETFVGRIARVSPVLDPATRTAPIEIEVPNPDYRLKPGMYARVGITTDTIKDALLIPSDAMADLGGRRGVFQVLNDSAVFRTVQVGTEQRNLVEILGGLKEGEEVITTGARALRDGDRVVLAGGQRGGGQGRRGGRQGAGDGASEGGAAAIKPAADAVQGTAPRQYGAREGGSRGTGTGFTPGEGSDGGNRGGFSGEGRRGRRGSGNQANPGASGGGQPPSGATQQQ